jgi:hypothetical protein
VAAQDPRTAEAALTALCMFHGLTPADVTSLTAAPNPGMQRTRYARR